MISGQKKVTFSSDAGNLEGENLFFRLTFGDATKYIKSDNFKYGSFNCSFGDLDVYLNDVIINESSATIDVDVKFGELAIYVPRNWRVNCQANKNFGEIHVDGLGNASADAKALIIRGDVNFGELRIIYI